MLSRGESFERQYQAAKEKIVKGDLDSAIIELQEIITEAEEVGDFNVYVKCINALGVAYSSMENENMAMDFYLKGLTVSQVREISGWTHLFCNNIGARYQELGDYREALRYYIMAEEELQLLEKEGDKEAAEFYVITYLNQSDCYRHIGEVEDAQRCVEQSARYAKEYNVKYCDFSIAVVQAYLNWYAGNYEAVYAKMDQLLEFARTDTDSVVDYTRNIDEFIQILSNMEEYDRVREVLEYFEAFVRKTDSVYLKLRLAELYMDYYRNIEDIESYRDACVEHAEYYKDYKIIREQDDILALNVKIELQRAEVERLIAERS